MKAPQWGKVTGILMIIFGSLGIFYQGYKLMIPSILRMQGEMWNNLDRLDPDAIQPQRQVFGSMQKMMSISPFHEQVLLIGGGIGLLLCVIYILGGVKMLKIGVKNLKIGKMILILSLSYNVIVAILMFSGERTIMTTGLSFYGIVGLVIDLVLLIVVLSSDVHAYNPDSKVEMDDLTLHSNSDEIL